MAEVLKVLHLADENGVAQMQIRGCRIEPGFDAEGAASLQALAKVFFTDQFGHTFADVGDLLVDWNHAGLLTIVKAAAQGAGFLTVSGVARRLLYGQKIPWVDSHESRPALLAVWAPWVKLVQ